MPNLTVQGEGENAKLVYSYSIAESGDHLLTLNTKNTFVDKNIEINAPVAAAGALTLDIDDLTSEISMGSPSEGYYEPTVNLSGDVSVASAGWITSGDHSISESGVAIGKIAQSTLANGSTAIDSGDEIIPEGTTDQTINITAGYAPARTVVVKSQSAGDKATVVSGSASIDSLTFTADDSDHTYNITGTGTVAAPSVSTPGYISSTLGTKTGNTASVDVTVDQVTVGVDASSTNVKVTPVIARSAKGGTDTFVDAASGAATTTKPSSGAYVVADVAAVSASATVSGVVSAAGYGDTSHYQADSATTITAGANAASTAYIPVSAGTVAAQGATISTVAVAYDSTNGDFDVTGAANIPAPTVSAAGYVGNDVGTVSGLTNGAAVSANLDKIAIGATLDDSGSATPVISKNAATNVEASAATTTQPSSGKYIAVQSASDTIAVSATAAVTSAGYGTTTTGQYTTSGDSGSVAVNASAVTYIPIAEASFGNTATSGQTYSDISSGAPVLVSGDYLYINKGYTDNVKISLAQLVPDDATITASTGADYILASQSAYDADGALVVGTIPTYAGSYTVA